MPIIEFDAFRARHRRTETGCWEWKAGTNGVGYGVFSHHSRRAYAHRWAYRHFVGPIPTGFDLDHLCRNTLCCNPSHLEPVTRRENVRRGPKARQASCVHGHPFTPENTYVTSFGHRQCRACKRIRQRELRARLREAAAA